MKSLLKTLTASNQPIWRRNALRVISFSALAAALSSCGGWVEKVEDLGLIDPFKWADKTKMENYHTPWIPAMKSPERFQPVLIPKIRKDEQWVVKSTIQPIHIDQQKELQNEWDNEAQVMKIYFPFNKKDLGDNDWKDLRALVAHYQRTGTKLRRMLIRGFADTVWNDVNNIALSQKRVDAVKKELIRQGINPNEVDIQFEAVGKREARSADNTKSHAERRVEIYITDAITESVAKLNPKPDVIFIDNSPSMQNNLRVLHNFFQRGGNPDTAFYVFDIPKIGLDAFDNNAGLLSRVGGRETPLYEALNGLSLHVANHASKLNGRKPVIAIVTDGAANGKEDLAIETEHATFHLVQVPGYKPKDLKLEESVRKSGGTISGVE